jgi:hypothetical protein
MAAKSSDRSGYGLDRFFAYHGADRQAPKLCRARDCSPDRVGSGSPVPASPTVGSAWAGEPVEFSVGSSPPVHVTRITPFCATRFPRRAV